MFFKLLHTSSRTTRSQPTGARSSGRHANWATKNRTTGR